ncbi:MAG: thiamine phosphate synthase [Acidovorax sp.]
MTNPILTHHGAAFAGHEAQPLPTPTQDGEAYRTALQAASALGFIAIDAECIARGWQRQTERMGRFDPACWPDDPRDFGIQGRQGNAFPPCPDALGLYAVLPDAAWVGRMARAGVPTVQLRFKSDDRAAITREVRAAVEAVRGTNARLFINDHWREAIAASAYGAHLGQEDLDALRPDELATLRASGLRLGVSTHGYAEMLRADAVGPSYVALGAVFPTTLKKMATAPQGVARLAAYARLMRGYPLVAIGGIAAEQFAQIRATGVGSIAVVRALVQASDPEQAAADLMRRMG